MQFNPATQKIEIDPRDATLAYHELRNALVHIRKLGGKPLDRYKSPGALDSADFAGCSILSAAKRLGLTMGAEFPYDLDLRDAE